MLLLGRRAGRYRKDGACARTLEHPLPGSWLLDLIVGWFGFNVMSAQTVAGLRA